MNRTPYAHIFVIIAFLINSFGTVPLAQADEFRLPAPGVMVDLSPKFNPIVLKGIKLDPKNPFRFHFYVDTGNSLPLRAGGGNEEELKAESAKLIKYFLASLTIPEKDLWVNLSPYEKDRIVPQEFGQTEMGRDLLAEDYILKQITASLIYPESHLGKEFWTKVYAQAEAQYGTTNIPINTFNKVWIVPDKAVVYENGGAAFVLENHLKVMLEQDYLSMQKHMNDNSLPLVGRVREGGGINALGSQIIREIVIPALTKEVNEGKNFSQLRQVFYSLILATWYKKKIKDSILNKVYSDRKKIQNLLYQKPNQDLSSPNVLIGDPEHIYQQYLKAFKKGVFNYIKEEPSFPPPGGEGQGGGRMPRKYFSGGVQAIDVAQIVKIENRSQVDSSLLADFAQNSHLMEVTGDTAMINQAPNLSADRAMKTMDLLPLEFPGELNESMRDGQTDFKEFPVYRVGSERVILKQTSVWGTFRAIFGSQIAHVIGFKEFNGVQIYSRKGKFGHVESYWGESLDKLVDPSTENHLLQSLDLTEAFNENIYRSLIEKFGESFVRGDVYRLFSNTYGDSSASDNIRVERSGDHFVLRWIDYNLSFTAPGYLREYINGYLQARADYIVKYGLDLVKTIVDLSDEDIEHVADHVYGKESQQLLARAEGISESDAGNKLQPCRSYIVMGIKIRRQIFKDFYGWLIEQHKLSKTQLSKILVNTVATKETERSLGDGAMKSHITNILSRSVQFDKDGMMKTEEIQIKAQQIFEAGQGLVFQGPPANDIFSVVLEGRSENVLADYGEYISHPFPEITRPKKIGLELSLTDAPQRSLLLMDEGEFERLLLHAYQLNPAKIKECIKNFIYLLNIQGLLKPPSDNEYDEAMTADQVRNQEIERLIRDAREVMSSADGEVNLLIKKKAELLIQIYPKLVVFAQRLVHAYSQLAKEYELNPGKIQLRMVGGRIRGKKIGAMTDLDLIFSVANPKTALCVSNSYRFGGQGDMERKLSYLVKEQIVELGLPLVVNGAKFSDRTSNVDAVKLDIQNWAQPIRTQDSPVFDPVEDTLLLAELDDSSDRVPEASQDFVMGAGREKDRMMKSGDEMMLDLDANIFRNTVDNNMLFELKDYPHTWRISFRNLEPDALYGKIQRNARRQGKIVYVSEGDAQVIFDEDLVLISNGFHNCTGMIIHAIKDGHPVIGLVHFSPYHKRNTEIYEEYIEILNFLSDPSNDFTHISIGVSWDERLEGLDPVNLPMLPYFKDRSYKRVPWAVRIRGKVGYPSTQERISQLEQEAQNRGISVIQLPAPFRLREHKKGRGMALFVSQRGFGLRANANSDNLHLQLWPVAGSEEYFSGIRVLETRKGTGGKDVAMAIEIQTGEKKELPKEPKVRADDVPFSTFNLKMDIEAFKNRTEHESVSFLLRELSKYALENNLNLRIDHDDLWIKRISCEYVIQVLVENLIQHEYEEDGREQKVYYRIYKVRDKVRLELWGPGKHNFPHYFLDKNSGGEDFKWFSAIQMPWYDAIAPPDARTGGGAHEAIGKMFGTLSLADYYNPDKRIIVGYRQDQEIGGHLIALEFPIFENIPGQEGKRKPGLDKAMNVDQPKSGGIDLNPAQMSMQVKKDGQEFKFDFNGTKIDAAQVAGVIFSIESIEPVKDLPAILGLR